MDIVVEEVAGYQMSRFAQQTDGIDRAVGTTDME